MDALRNKGAAKQKHRDQMTTYQENDCTQLYINN